MKTEGTLARTTTSAKNQRMSNDERTQVVNHEFRAAFVPAWLDDLGLDVYAFRVYGRLKRRADAQGISYESVKQMSAATGMSERRMHQAFKDLEEVGLLKREFREYTTTLYHLLQPANLTHAQPAPPQASPAGGTEQGAGGTAPDADKGTPLKELHLRPSTEGKTKDSFSDADAQEFIDIYNQHRGDLPKAMAANADRKRKLKAFVKQHGVEEAKALLEAATRQVSTDSFWLEKGYGLGNLLANGNYLKHAEAWEANKPKEPAYKTNIEYRATMEYARRVREGQECTYEEVKAELEAE